MFVHAAKVADATLRLMPPPARWLNAGSVACLAVAAGAGTCAAGALAEGGGMTEIALSTLGLEIFLGLFAVALVLPGPAPPAWRLGLGPGRLSLAQLVLLAVGTLGLSHGLDAVLDATGLRDASALAELDRALAATRGAPLALAYLSLVLAPAIGEELMCRGLIQRGLELRIGARAAVPLAAALFGAMHMEPIHATVAGLLGLYLGLVAWLAASIRASIFCHLVNNLVAVATTVSPETRGEPGWTLTAGPLLALLLLGFVWWRAGTPPPLQAQRRDPLPLERNALPLQPQPGSDDA